MYDCDMKPPSLFDHSYLDWQAQPSTAFECWLARRPLKKVSMETYRWMWLAFLRWLDSRGRTLGDLQVDEIKDFVEKGEYRKVSLAAHAKPGSADANHSLYSYHYLKLIEHVYGYVNGLPDAPQAAINPAAEALKGGVRTGKNNAPSFFPRDACERLIALVEGAEMDKGEKKGKNGETDRSALPRQAEWRQPRDLAMIGLLLGGGLRVSELTSLTISCINENGIILPYSPKTRGADKDGDEGAGLFGRTIQLEPFAVKALERWLAILSEDGAGNGVLFPAKKNGGAIDSSNVLRRVKVLLQEAEVAEGKEMRTCGQTLRNCHAANLIERNWEDSAIMAQMGWVDPLTALRFRLAYDGWKMSA